MSHISLEQRLEDLEKRVAELENNSPERHMSQECQRHQCSYFIHYLAYGPADLTHEGFHAAEKNCERVQKLAQDWMDRHKGDREVFPKHLERLCATAEARVRA